MCDRHNVSREAGRLYLESLHQHIGYVLEAGLHLGVPHDQLSIHDQSKFSEWEFPHYARQFHGGGGDDEGFARAWLHHENHNPHHWGYWIPRSGKYTGQPLEMPHNYALEMVADWMGANRAYDGSWNMEKWLNKSFPGIKLHDATREFVADTLHSLGYLVSYDMVHDTCNIRATAANYELLE